MNSRRFIGSPRGRPRGPEFEVGAVGAFDGKDSTPRWGRRLLRCGILMMPMSLVGHVWTAPAVQEESDNQRSVRVRSCIRPVVAWRIASVAMQPVWPLALM